MKKGQQIRELPMRRCVLTFAGAVEGPLLGLFGVCGACWPADSWSPTFCEQFGDGNG